MIVNFLFDKFVNDGDEPWWNMPDIPRERITEDTRTLPKIFGWWHTKIIDALTADNPNITHENEIRIVRTLEHDLRSDEINIYPVFVSDKVFEYPNALLWLPSYVVDQINLGLVHLVILNYFEPDFVDHTYMYDRYKFYLSVSGITNFSKVSIVGNSYISEQNINALRSGPDDLKYINCHAWEKYPLKYLHKHQASITNYLNLNQSKVFLMQIRSPRPWRYFTYKYLEYMNVLDNGLYSYVINNNTPTTTIATDNFDNHRNDSFVLNEYTFEQELLRSDKEFLTYLKHNGEIQSKILPGCQLDNTNVLETAAYVDNDWIKETYFSVICESQMYKDNGIISEKTFKMIYYGHPFILVGTQGMLKELRNIGYETFPELFDESYDDMPCSMDKIKFIATQVSKWCDISRRDELNQIIRGIYPKLLHNRNLFISKDHSKFWNNFK